MNADFSSRLTERVLAGAAPAVVGLDPRPDALPTALSSAGSPVERIVAFYREALPALAAHIPVVKPNIAFFEAFGTAGFAAYAETCALAREAGLLVIGDVKRGDIGSTAEAYAQAHFPLADAVTLHPYLGSDALEPFLKRCKPGPDGGRGVFVLVRTSNPSAREFQDLELKGGGTLATAVAAAVHRWGAELGDPGGYSPVGAVVGATWPDELARLRQVMPRAWLLLPGVGAQGAEVGQLAAAYDDRGLGALVSQSRGVMHCFRPDDADWLAQIEVAARRFAEDTLEVARS